MLISFLGVCFAGACFVHVVFRTHLSYCRCVLGSRNFPDIYFVLPVRALSTSFSGHLFVLPGRAWFTSFAGHISFYFRCVCIHVVFRIHFIRLRGDL